MLLDILQVVVFLALGRTLWFGDCLENKKWVDKGVEIETLYQPSDCSYRSKENDILTTDYVGKFLDGTKFDSTYDRKEAMTYTMGQGNVIKGCEIGTMNMCKGEKRYLVIPPDLAYGQKQYGQIPPNSTLTFEIVLTDLQEDPFKAFDAFSAFSDFGKL